MFSLFVQMWERNLEEYRKTLHHLPESRDRMNPILESASKGREDIISSLMNMNARYEKLLNEVQLVMEEFVENLKRQGKEHKEVSLCFPFSTLSCLITNNFHALSSAIIKFKLVNFSPCVGCFLHLNNSRK